MGDTKVGTTALRAALYVIACDNFVKAYDRNPRTFTLFRIETALESCMRVNHDEGRQIFEEFREKYIKEHPAEAEYGDFMPPLDAG